jgi:tetratricopeptide (TPR) repeat protein
MLVRINFITVCLILSFLTASSQKIDSLKLIIDKSSGSDKVDAIITLVREIALHDDQEALAWALKAKDIAFTIGDTSRMVISSRMAGTLFNRLSMSKEAEKILSEILPIAERNKLRIDYKKILTNLAIVYLYQAKYDKALALNFKVLALHEADKDEDGASAVLGNIGVIYYKLMDHKKGLSYFIKSLEKKVKINDFYDFDIMLSNASLALAFTNEYQKAKIYADSALKVCGGEKCRDSRLIEINFSLGVIYLGLNEPHKAERHFIKSYEIATKLGNDRFQFDNIVYLAKIAIDQNELSKAIRYLQEAETLIENGEPFNLELIKIYKLLAKVYNQQGNFERAMFYQQKYIQLRDGTYNDQLTTNLMRIEAEYLERENLSQISMQNEMIALKEEAISRQKALSIAMVILAIGLVILAVILAMIYRSKKTHNIELDKKVKERTSALQQSHEELMRLTRERDMLIVRTAEDINSSLATIKGLCSVGFQDVTNIKAKEYMMEMQETSGALSFSVKNLKSFTLVP